MSAIAEYLKQHPDKQLRVLEGELESGTATYFSTTHCLLSMRYGRTWYSFFLPQFAVREISYYRAKQHGGYMAQDAEREYARTINSEVACLVRAEMNRRAGVLTMPTPAPVAPAPQPVARVEDREGVWV